MFQKTSKLIKRFKRKKGPLKNTFEILQLTKILSYIFGFRVVEYPRDQSWPKFSFFYSILLYSLYYAGRSLKLQKYPQKSDKLFDMQDAIYKSTTTIDYVAMFVILIMGYYHSQSLKVSVRRIHEVDLTLRALGSPTAFNAIHSRTIAMLTFIFSIQILFIVLYFYALFYLFPDNFNHVKVVLTAFTQCYSQILEFLLTLEFFVIISCIDSEFQRANDLLADINVLPVSSIAIELFDYQNSSDPFSTNKSFFEKSTKLFTLLPSSRRLRSRLQTTSHEIIRSRRLLQTIRQVHLELYRVSKRICMIYGMQISMEICLCILFTTYSLYSLYRMYHLEDNNDTVLILSTTGTCMLCFADWLKVYSINYICGKTAQQAQRTNEIIFTFYGQNTDSELLEEMEIFSLQMMHCQLTYSAAGLYSLNCKNLCACAGFITTYVVIMIQVTS